MNAILLAAGFGTRLRPLTDTVPKCLVPIDGEPLLDIWLRRLADAGIAKFLVNTHYLGATVSGHLQGSHYRDRIRVVYEETLLGTAGTLLANLDFLDGADGFLIHTDNWCVGDLDAFVVAHRNRPADCLMTMMCFRTPTPSTSGIVELDSRGVVVGFHEKVAAPPGNLANSAVYLLSAELQQLLRTRFPDALDFSTEVMPHLVGKICAWETSDPFLDIGTPQTYAQACALAAQRRAAGLRD